MEYVSGLINSVLILNRYLLRFSDAMCHSKYNPHILCFLVTSHEIMVKSESETKFHAN